MTHQPRRIREWHEATPDERMWVIDAARHNASNDNEADEFGLVDVIIGSMALWTLIIGLIAVSGL